MYSIIMHVWHTKCTPTAYNAIIIRSTLYYNDDTSLPVFKWIGPHYHFSIEDLGKILVTDYVSSIKLCSKQPTRVFRNAAFVGNLDSLDAFNDIKADENGVWKRKGAPVGYVSVHDSSEVVH